MPLALRVNAVVSAVFGVVLLAATWEGLYDTLDIPQPRPWVYAQLLGAALLGLAWIAWRAAAADEAQTRLVAQGCAILDLVGFVIIAIWVFSDDVGIPSSGSLGSWIFDITAVGLLVLGIIEARAFRKP
jgi:cytochrome bd-type quinol oxidase subunit 2